MLRMTDVGVHPGVRPEPDGLGDGEEDAGVPVDDDQDVKHKVADSENVGVVCPGFRSVKELKEARHLAEAVESELWIVVTVWNEGKISRYHRYDVIFKLLLGSVVFF